MPFYEYRCERGHTFEVLQRMSDDPVAVCTTCGQPVQRVLHPVAVHFKGSGFYTTDYGKRKNGPSGGESSSSDSEGKKESKKDGGSGSSDGGSGSSDGKSGKSEKAASKSSD